MCFLLNKCIPSLFIYSDYLQLVSYFHIIFDSIWNKRKLTLSKGVHSTWNFFILPPKQHLEKNRFFRVFHGLDIFQIAKRRASENFEKKGTNLNPAFYIGMWKFFALTHVCYNTMYSWKLSCDMNVYWKRELSFIATGVKNYLKMRT